jgi:two-component system, chemotaxis family, protein-glutamate methylesterase/glutaminase
MATKKNICVLVVDDSPLVRQAIKNILETEKRIGKVDVAPNGKLALRKIAKLDPDVVTLDIEMPEMDGIATLKRIMLEFPRPVIMLSAFTTRGADNTIKALELGAVDFIPKPSGKLSKDIREVGEELVKKIIAVSSSTKRKSRKGQAAPVLQTAKRSNKQENVQQTDEMRFEKIVAVGASTGGTEAIRKVLIGLPQDFSAGIVVVQHMPAGFTRSFAERLNELCAIEVKEAADRDLILPGRALIAPGHSHLTVERGEYGDFVKLGRGAKVNGHRPSVDVLFNSVADAYRENVIGVLLTGMGQDGALGMRRMFNAGALTIAQDENSSIVYGMPRAAVEEGCVQRIADIENIPAIIKKNTQGHRRSEKSGSCAGDQASVNNILKTAETNDE